MPWNGYAIAKSNHSHRGALPPCPPMAGAEPYCPHGGNRRSTEPYCPHGAIGGVGIVLPAKWAIDAEQIILTLICDIYFVYKTTMKSVII